MSSLAKRLWIYQKERFPLGILTITTAAVLASTFAVLEWTGYYDIPLWKYVALGVAGLSFMLHTRIIDEIRDKEVDDVHHPDRPVQRGLVSIRELTVLGYANGGVFHRHSRSCWIPFPACFLRACCSIPSWRATRWALWPG